MVSPEGKDETTSGSKRGANGRGEVVRAEDPCGPGRPDRSGRSAIARRANSQMRQMNGSTLTFCLLLEGSILVIYSELPCSRFWQQRHFPYVG